MMFRTELINLAIKRLNQNKGNGEQRIVMALSEFPLAKQERDLVRLAGGGRLIVVPHTRPQGVSVPQRFMGDFPQEGSAPVPLANIGLLPWILNPEEAPEPYQDDTVQLFRALGDSNEVREVFRRIISAGVAFDTVEILVTRAEPYVSIIYEISKELDIPVTFAGGIPIGYTRPGRALDLYLEWMLEDFPADGLRRLLAGGYLKREVLKQGEEVLSPGKAAALIREAGIGWGRLRYGSRLNSLEESYLLRAEELRGEGEEERPARAERKAVEVSGIEAFVAALLDTVPACSPDDPIAMEALARASIEFVKRFCRVAGELDGAAKNALLERLDTFTKTPTFPEPFTRLVERMRGLMGGMTVGHSGPKPGQVHLAHYRAGGYSGRPWTFVLGLDQARFPGPMLQDPVLLDRERTKLSPALVLSSELLEENLYTLARVLASIEGRVTLSYSCRDLQEDRERFPSSLLLGAYRLISGNRTGDYSDLKRFLGEPAGFIPEKGELPLNGWEWWLSLEGTRYDRKSVLASYPNLEAGETAESERDASTQTEFDGWIPSAGGSMDPLTQDTALSCSRLEALAKCPFAFFLRYVLGIEPLEEMKKDGSQWLDPLQRGQLLHAVFCLFMEAMVKRKERPAVKKHGALLAKLAQEEIDRWKEEVPPASPLAFRREEEDIQKALKIFLREEEEHCQKIEPVWLELSFGAGAESGCGTLIKDPVEIFLPGGRGFQLRGRIDRIDRSAEHEYEVWDYKTGSSYGYKEEGYLDRGRQLQHALYAQAAEIILKRDLDKKAKVVRSGYFFPGAKGEGLRIVRVQDKKKKAELHEVLNDLFEMLRNGLFPYSPDKDPCGFCDFKKICGGAETAVPRSADKLAGDAKMDPLKRLKEHV